MTSRIPSLGVIMPVHNGERFLGEAISSVLEQTFADFELIVVDDGSSDGTCDIVRGYIERDPRVRLVRTGKNGGSHHARNLGIAATRAALVAFCDADDVCDPRKLERQLDELRRRPELAAVATYALYVSEDLSRTVGWYRTRLSPEEIRETAPMRNVFPMAFAMCRREALGAIGGFNEALKFSDYFVALRLAAQFDLAVIPEDLYRIRVHALSLSQMLAEDMAPGILDSLAAHYAVPTRQEAARICREYIRAYLAKHLGQRRFHIFGTGACGRALFRELGKERMLGWLDSCPDRSGGDIDELPVRSPGDLSEGDDSSLILCASLREDELTAELQRAGVADDRVVRGSEAGGRLHMMKEYFNSSA